MIMKLGLYELGEDDKKICGFSHLVIFDIYGNTAKVYYIISCDLFISQLTGDSDFYKNLTYINDCTTLEEIMDICPEILL